MCFANGKMRTVSKTCEFATKTEKWVWRTDPLILPLLEHSMLELGWLYNIFFEGSIQKKNMPAKKDKEDLPTCYYDQLRKTCEKNPEHPSQP